MPNGGVRLLPGTRDFLDSLPADRWAVVTSATGRLAEAAGPAAGMTTVALATTHRAQELDAELVVENLSALSALGTHRGLRISVRG